jgi:hypothetical protein
MWCDGRGCGEIAAYLFTGGGRQVANFECIEKVSSSVRRVAPLRESHIIENAFSAWCPLGSTECFEYNIQY